MLIIMLHPCNEVPPLLSLLISRSQNAVGRSHVLFHTHRWRRWLRQRDGVRFVFFWFYSACKHCQFPNVIWTFFALSISSICHVHFKLFSCSNIQTRIRSDVEHIFRSLSPPSGPRRIRPTRCAHSPGQTFMHVLIIDTDKQHLMFVEVMGCKYPDPLAEVMADDTPGETKACLDIGCGNGNWYASLKGQISLLTV